MKPELKDKDWQDKQEINNQKFNNVLLNNNKLEKLKHLQSLEELSFKENNK